jgi:hypothetical protein
MLRVKRTAHDNGASGRPDLRDPSEAVLFLKFKVKPFLNMCSTVASMYFCSPTRDTSAPCTCACTTVKDETAAVLVRTKRPVALASSILRMHLLCLPEYKNLFSPTSSKSVKPHKRSTKTVLQQRLPQAPAYATIVTVSCCYVPNDCCLLTTILSHSFTIRHLMWSSIVEP